MTVALDQAYAKQTVDKARVDVRKGHDANGKTEVFGKLEPGDIIVEKATDEIRNESNIAVRSN